VKATDNDGDNASIAPWLPVGKEGFDLQCKPACGTAEQGS